MLSIVCHLPSSGICSNLEKNLMAMNILTYIKNAIYEIKLALN